MGSWCATPSAQAKPEVQQTTSLEKTLKSKQPKELQRSVKKKAKEESVDYSDFRNNPIYKPAPLSNPQDNETSDQKMGLSMAAAAKESNLRPKDEKRKNNAEFKADMKNVNDTVRESDCSSDNQLKRPTGDSNVLLSFKPNNLNEEITPNSSCIDMTFNGEKQIKMQTNGDSTIIRGNEETQDQSRADQDEFVYKSVVRQAED